MKEAFPHNKRILVTGGTGMVGHALKEYIPQAVFVGSEWDLRSENETDLLFRDHRPNYVINLAARVGGVKANKDNIADFYRDNILIGTNVLHCAKRHDVEKVLSLLSTCIYPDNASSPLTEDQIHSGEPHESNFGYAFAKRMLDVQSRAYREQYGCNFITVAPNNLFGEYDNFDLENSHVIPAIMRKMHEASLKGENVYLWGDGTPLRAFTYSQDLARILLLLLARYEGDRPINAGDTKESSIKDIAEKIAGILEFKGEIIWQTDMPKGQHRKLSDSSKLESMGWKSDNYTDINVALKKTCKWFIENYPDVRGIKKGV